MVSKFPTTIYMVAFHQIYFFKLVCICDHLGSCNFRPRVKIGWNFLSPLIVVENLPAF